MTNDQIVVVVVLVIASVVGAIVALVALVRRRRFWGRLDRWSLIRSKLVALEQVAIGRVVESKVQHHLPALMRRYRQTVRQDDYGLEIRDDWERELDYFLARVVLQGPLAEDFSTLLDNHAALLASLPTDADRVTQRLRLGVHYLEPHSHEDEIFTWITTAYRNYPMAVIESLVRNAIGQEHKDRGGQFDASMSGEDFELFCAEQLSRAGWKSRVIGATGDQGGDIVAVKDGRRVVLQCKKYSSPVGNAAVQEAFAAMQYHAAQAACVVSNAGYTKAALQLAATTGVRLLHYSELGELDKLASRVVNR